MAQATFRTEEKIGLGAAVVLHVTLVAVLLLQREDPEPFDLPERMTVSLAEDVGLEATAPDPVPESRAATAPTLSPEPAPAPMIEAPQTTPIPAPAASTAPPPPAPRPRATTAPRTRPTSRPTSSPRTSTEPRRRPDKPASQPAATPARGGGSRIGSDFLPGSGASTTSTETRMPASQIGASAKASIVQAIARQIKPHWNAPSGADADQLVSILAFNLNEDGSLRGKPRLVSQSGITDSNRPQADLHAERAIRAVQLAAPFDLPAEYYNAWKSISGARFDRNLSQ